MNRIVLIGFPGSGKSTLGRKLARTLYFDFFDLDSCFEEFYHVSISDFFQKYGEKAFRLCEKRLLGQYLQKDHCVIATGGGTPCFFDSMALILQNSLSVYIRLSAESLVHRLRNSKKKRPLLRGLSDKELSVYVAQTLGEREAFYNRAHVIVKGENLAVPVLLQTLEAVQHKGREEVAPPGIEPESKV